MSFDFGCLKILEGFSTVRLQAIHRDLRTGGARGGGGGGGGGGRIEDP